MFYLYLLFILRVCSVRRKICRLFIYFLVFDRRAKKYYLENMCIYILWLMRGEDGGTGCGVVEVKMRCWKVGRTLSRWNVSCVTWFSYFLRKVSFLIFKDFSANKSREKQLCTSEIPRWLFCLSYYLVLHYLCMFKKAKCIIEKNYDSFTLITDRQGEESGSFDRD